MRLNQRKDVAGELIIGNIQFCKSWSIGKVGERSVKLVRVQLPGWTRQVLAKFPTKSQPQNTHNDRN